MKKILLPVVAIIVLSCFSSCSTDFNVAAPYKSITIAYGVLDMADTAHYVRIQKAFLDNNKSALQLAKNADSIYFPQSQLTVVVKAVNISTKTVDNVFTLTRVDLTNEGYPKESGNFVTVPNYAYKFKNTLLADHTYRLVISNSATGEVDSSETPVINDLNANAFNIPAIDPTIITDGLAFFSTNPNQNFKDINGQYTIPANSNESLPAIYQSILRFRWVDSSSAGYARDSADYDLGTLTSGSAGFANNDATSSFSFVKPNLSIYQFLQTSLGTAASGHYRIFDSCRVLVYAGTSAIANYQQFSQVSGTGLTGDMIEPVYTTMKGKNVYGIFAGRGLRSGRALISQKTLDSLSQNSTLSAAHIVNHHF